MKKIVIIVIVLLVLSALAVTWLMREISPYGSWKQVGTEGFDLLSGNLVYTTATAANGEKVAVFYDQGRIGIFCTKMDEKKPEMVCVPFILNRADIAENEKLSDVMEAPMMSRAMMTKVEISNHFWQQKMQIMVYSLNAACAKNKSCEWKNLPKFERNVFWKN